MKICNIFQKSNSASPSRCGGAKVRDFSIFSFKLNLEVHLKKARLIIAVIGIDDNSPMA